jgi:predicted Zn-dependent protease
LPLVKITCLKNLITYFTVYFISVFLFGQQHQKLESSEEYKEQYVAQTSAITKSILNNYSGGYKKEVKEVVKKSLEIQELYVESDFFFFHKETLDYLYALLGKLEQENPDIDFRDISLSLARDPSPNAFAMVNGSITFNVGIFPYLEKESYLVAIMAHEVSHYLKRHSLTRIEEKIAKQETKEYQEELKRIEKAEYNTVTLKREFTFTNKAIQRANSRKDEHEADITGLKLYLNTDYPPSEYIEGIAQLDRFNEAYDTTRLYVFRTLQMDVIKKPQTKSLGFIDKDINSAREKLKTHPDVPQRIDSLEVILKDSEISEESSKSYDNSEFQRIRKVMLFEKCEAYLVLERYDKGLLYAARLKRHYIDSKYLDAIIAYTFHRLYEARKDHDLNLYSEMPGDQADTSFNELLTALYYGRMKTLETALFDFCNKWDSDDQNDPRFLVSYGAVAQSKSDQEKFKELKRRYATQVSSEDKIKAFPNIKY